MNNILEIKNLDAFYNKKQYLYDINFSMKKEEVLGLVGESGSGKSTIGKAIVGILKETKGEIIVEKNSYQMIFQNTLESLNPSKKIGWILEEPLKMMGIKSKKLRIEKISSMLEKVGLNESFKTRYANELSGGQRQRIGIAIALLQESSLIIADEPVSALDVTVQSNILKLLKKLQKEMGLSYLFISHDLQVIKQISDRVIVLEKGRIVEQGTIEEIFENPQKEYTKKLLKANLL